ncbi:MAG: anti-sigma factor family protein [Planctomycetota bacterium]|jgi:hypothetical protein
MNRDPCPEMDEKLVDFADGVLSGVEAAGVRQHLAQCAQCRATVEALRQSLEAAQSIWQDNTAPTSRVRTLPSHRWRYVAAAACVALAVGGVFFWPARRQPAANPPTMAEIENRIAASASAARMLAAAGQLETQTALRDVTESQYRYIVDKYPDTPAAEPARRKLESLR